MNNLVLWRKAVNDNEHHTFGIVESAALNQFLIVEYDGLGPIMRLGPYASRHHALERMNALIGMVAARNLDDELRRRSRRHRRPDEAAP
jgi:hypothetical protein